MLVDLVLGGGDIVLGEGDVVLGGGDVVLGGGDVVSDHCRNQKALKVCQQIFLGIAYVSLCTTDSPYLQVLVQAQQINQSALHKLA